MPNTGHKWTKEEEAVALATSQWALFHYMLPDISYHAYRHKRFDLMKERERSLFRKLLRAVGR